MKKLLSIILALALTASFVACDNDDTDVKMPDVSSESEALTYEEAIEPFAESEEIIILQQKAWELYYRFECILHYYYGWGLCSFTDESGVTITTEDGITDDMNAISEYLDSCDQYVTAASEISNAMFRDAYISFSDASRELYDMLAERNGVIPEDKETITESAVFTSLGLYNLVLSSSIIDESRAIYYISDYSHTLEDLFAIVEVYCRLYDEDDYERVSEDSETSGFYHRASQLLWIYLDGVDLSHDASEIDITYITSTLGYFLAYKPNIEAIGVEAYEGDSQKQAQLDDFFEQATKLYNTLVATPPSFGDESYITKNEFDVDVIEELVKKINE